MEAKICRTAWAIDSVVSNPHTVVKKFKIADIMNLMGDNDYMSVKYIVEKFNYLGYLKIADGKGSHGANMYFRTGHFTELTNELIKKLNKIDEGEKNEI